MAEQTALLPISGCDDPERLADVIFVHGLDGDARSTWHPKDQPEHFWPAWLGEDMPQLGVWTLNYAVSASAWKGHSMPLVDRANNVLDLFALEDIGQRPLALICHSLGGLLMKQVLRNARDALDPQWHAIVEQTQLMVFLSTPHSGANMASWISYLGTLLRLTVSVEELEAHHPRLRELNIWYRDHVAGLGIRTFVYYETLPTARMLVVDATTADPGIPGVRPIPVDEDHVTICKPASKDTRIYRQVKRLIEHSILRADHPSASFARYYQDCIVRWSGERYALDKRFVQLTLLLDQGAGATGPRWQPASETFSDLSEVLVHTSHQPIVVLGSPGSGKSTLLRHFELDHAREMQANLAGDDLSQMPLTFFVPLNDYKPDRLTHRLPPPLDWLAERWESGFPDLPPLKTLLQQRRLTLLLDALNEIPVAGEEPIQLWKAFLDELEWHFPGNRVIFSCRLLDYSAKLSSNERPVRQVRIEPLSDVQVEEFVTLYCPDSGAALWQNLKGTPQLEVFRSPYYLKLLVAQTTEGEIPVGRSALFTGCVRQALQREVNGESELFQPDSLVHQRDVDRLGTAGKWPPFALPERGLLLPKLSALAFQMQTQHTEAEASQVRITYDEALDLLDHPQAEDVIKAGEALGVLDEDRGRDEVLFVHQLFQEYFAARQLARAPQAEWVHQDWQIDRVTPSLPITLAGLADSDPLPPLPSTGWEETTVLAAAMATDPNRFVADLMAHNLALAGRCAAQPEVSVSDALRQTLRWALVERTQDTSADVRVRIAAGLALGELGDPRFERRQGPYGAYLLPPLIEIPGGTYRMGSDEGLSEGEAPVHSVPVSAFAIGQFPVTNAEWALFMQAGGYEEECWWETEDARTWRRGEDTAAGPKQQQRDNRKGFQDNVDRVRQWHEQGRLTSEQAEGWEEIARMSDDEFEALLADWFPGGRQTQPAYWHDEAFNNPAQPVVGICWFEARAYCAWLSAQTGQTFRLPTEAEWEAAVGGVQRRRFAFGDDFDASRCNTFETHIRHTTPIGVFPGGETPEGVVDMTGNSWEWTSSLYQPYPYQAEDGREEATATARRVVRGGSWYDTERHARARFRNFDVPAYRDYDLGLRVVRSSPSLS